MRGTWHRACCLHVWECQPLAAQLTVLAGSCALCCICEALCLVLLPLLLLCSGTGIKLPLGSRVTIEGLQSNETYNFAIAGELA